MPRIVSIFPCFSIFFVWPYMGISDACRMSNYSPSLTPPPPLPPMMLCKILPPSGVSVLFLHHHVVWLGGGEDGGLLLPPPPTLVYKKAAACSSFPELERRRRRRQEIPLKGSFLCSAVSEKNGEGLLRHLQCWLDLGSCCFASLFP